MALADLSAENSQLKLGQLEKFHAIGQKKKKKKSQAKSIFWGTSLERSA